MKTRNILYFTNPAEPEPKRATALLFFNKISAIKNTKIILKRLTWPGARTKWSCPELVEGSYRSGGQIKYYDLFVYNIFSKRLTFFSRILSIGIIFIFTGISYGDEKTDNSKLDIPYDFLIDSRKEEARQLVVNHSIFRSMQEIEFNIDRSILVFMLDHPDFLSVTLKVMKIRNYVVKNDTNRGYAVDDLKGTSGRIEVIYSSDGRKYFYGAGEHKGIFIDVTGKGLILFEYHRNSINPSRTIVGFNSYTKIENVVLEFFMKILKPILVPLMSRKINKFIEETQKLADEITVHPEKVYQAIKESGLAEEEALEEFRKLVF